MAEPVSPPLAPALPAPDCDVLYGLSAIATWLGMSVQQCRPLVADGLIPTFRPPGRTTRCALKSAIHATWVGLFGNART